jgi:hypothetical protein
MKIEVFYTGGGIWLAETVINDKGDYAVVNNECPEILSIYHKAEEKYMEDDMYLSKPWDELSDEMALTHAMMFQALRKKGALR